MACRCETRAVRLMRWMGWSRNADDHFFLSNTHGAVFLDIRPEEHHARLAVLGLLVRVLHGSQATPHPALRESRFVPMQPNEL